MTHQFKFLIILATTLFLLLSCSNSNEVAGTISETEGGLMGVVMSSVNQPQAGVAVSLHDVHADDSTVADTITNSNGEYHFRAIPSGTYYIEGSYLDDSRELFFKTADFTYDSSLTTTESFTVEPSQLEPTGSVQGHIIVANGDHENVLLSLAGKEYSVSTHNMGRFTFSGIPVADDHVLRVEYHGNFITSLTSIRVFANDTTELQPISL